MKKINLEVDKTITALAGDPYGKELSEKQVRPILKNIIKEESNEKVIVVIPETIKNITISFVQGFAKGISDIINIENFYDIIEIKGNPRVVNSFNEYIYY